MCAPVCVQRAAHKGKRLAQDRSQVVRPVEINTNQETNKQKSQPEKKEEKKRKPPGLL